MSRLPSASLWKGVLTLVPFTITLIFVSSPLYGQKVGVGTAAPEAGLHVFHNDGILVNGDFGQGILPISGYGTRLMWQPKTASFRFGRLTDEDAGIYEQWWHFTNTGDYSFGGGVNVKASGYASFAMGHKNQATATRSFVAGGESNLASGYNSFAAGYNNTAFSFNEFVVGMYAKEYTPMNTSSYAATDRIFVVGNGTGTGARSNAFTILKNGNSGIGTDTPEDKLHVLGNVRIDGANLLFANTGSSVFIGENAGGSDDLTDNNNIFIGTDAGMLVTSGSNNVAIGRSSLELNSTGTHNLALGTNALFRNTTSENIAIGYRSLYNTTTGPSNLAIGDHAMFFNDTGTENVALGEQSLYVGTNGSRNVAVGFNAGLVGSGSNNTFVGHEAGYSNSGSGNVFLGRTAGYNETGSDKLYIENSNTSSPLIYGDFDKNKVIVNDSLQSEYFRMTNSAGSNKILQSDAVGNAAWVEPNAVFSDDWSSTGDDIYNSNEANVGIGTDAPIDKLHVLGNVRVDSGRINIVNTGLSVFIGDDAGMMDDLTSNRNVFIGDEAGQSSVSGENNIAVGAGALFSNTTASNNIAIGRTSMSSSTTGSNNIAIGTYAMDEDTSGNSNIAIGFESLTSLSNGNSNTAIGHKSLRLAEGSNNTAVGFEAGYNATGAGNVFIGHNAGRTETGDNKLYIDNSSTSMPLIHGDFSTNKVTINDSLQSEYFRMTNSSGLNKILQSDADGNATWVEPNAVFSDDWSSTGDDIYNSNEANVGIGTNAPIDKLHVLGNVRVDSGRINIVNTGLSIFIGNDAGMMDDLTTNRNIFIGDEAGQNSVSGENNIAVGAGALFSNSSASNNIAIGRTAMSSATTGGNNIAIGTYAMDEDTSGYSNIAIGFESLTSLSDGNSNTAIGHQSLKSTVGSNNTAVGFEAGYDAMGNGNVFIGYNAGREETGSDKLYIDNNSTSMPLIHGDFSANKVTINDSLQSTYFRMTNGATDGHILVSSNNGQGSWTAPNAVFSDDWNSNAGHIYNANTLNVGIGTSNPTDPLHVNGILRVNAGRIKITGTGQSVFIGEDAGVTDNLSTNNNVFIGHHAGKANSDGESNIALGSFALDGTVNSNYNIAIGQNVLGDAGLSGEQNTGIGNFSLAALTSGAQNTAIGQSVANSLTDGLRNVAIGNYAMDGTTTGNYNTTIGYESLGNNVIGSSNTVMGHYAGYSILGNNNVMIGYNAGLSTSGSGNVFLGTEAGFNEAGDDKLYIDNSGTSSPLIYGDFSTNKVIINDSLESKYFRMSTGGVDGYVLKSDANGRATWANPTTFLNTMWTLNGSNELYNSNAGTNVGIGTSDPQTQLHVSGDMTIQNGRLDFINDGNGTFVGSNAGANDVEANDNASTFIGYEAGMANTTGSENTAIGANAFTSNTTGGANAVLGNGALQQNTDGARNVALGYAAVTANTSGDDNVGIGYFALNNSEGNENIGIGSEAGNDNTSGNNNVFIGHGSGYSNTGSGNVFLGYHSGFNETGNDRLYIDNSNTSAPLIHGNFSTNEITINDSLTVNKELGVATSTPASTFEVNGSVAAKFKTPLVAGTTNPDATGMVWRYSSGTGTITLPGASTCANRIYVIINQTGTPRTISSYRDLTTTPQTTINSSVALWLMSDGTEWWQIK